MCASQEDDAIPPLCASESDNGEDAESSSSTNDSVESDDAMGQIRQAQNSFMYFEKEMRCRTPTMTANEFRQMKMLSLPLAQRASEEPHNFVLLDLWCTRLLDEGPAFFPGQSAICGKDLWTLLKLRLTAQRANQLPADSVPCYCLPEGAFQPSGCQHRREPFISCLQCRKCSRCGLLCRKLELDKHGMCSCQPAGLDQHEMWRH